MARGSHRKRDLQDELMWLKGGDDTHFLRTLLHSTPFSHANNRFPPSVPNASFKLNVLNVLNSKRFKLF